jgi:DNA-binding response OmpR family regulator
MPELVARVRGLIRRSAGHASAMIQAGPIRVDTRQMQVTVDGASVPLTPLEYRLVTYLVHNIGRVVPPGELLEHLYGDDESREANALEALVMRARKKLGTNTIETRRGFGYLIPEGPT